MSFMNQKKQYPPYPTENHQEMIAALDIQAHERREFDMGLHYRASQAEYKSLLYEK